VEAAAASLSEYFLLENGKEVCFLKEFPCIRKKEQEAHIATKDKTTKRPLIFSVCPVYHIMYQDLKMQQHQQRRGECIRSFAAAAASASCGFSSRMFAAASGLAAMAYGNNSSKQL
jgi:hypothetical protein